jgi:hypothetical protein
MPSLNWNSFEKIKPDRKILIGGVKIHNVIRSPGWNVIKNFFGEIAVRIDDRDAFTRLNVLENQIAEQRRFSGARFPNHVNVMAPICTPKTEGFGASPNLPVADIYKMFAHDLN